MTCYSDQWQVSKEAHNKGLLMNEPIAWTNAQAENLISAPSKRVNRPWQKLIYSFSQSVNPSNNGTHRCPYLLNKY